MQIVSIVCVITIVWMIIGYSIAFTPIDANVLGTNPIYGNLERVWFIGMRVNSRHQLAPNIPEMYLKIMIMIIIIIIIIFIFIIKIIM